MKNKTRIRDSERAAVARALLGLRAKGRVLSEIRFSVQTEATARAAQGRYVVAEFSYRKCGYGQFRPEMAIQIG
jgi:hypothetical protein